MCRLFVLFVVVVVCAVTPVRGGSADYSFTSVSVAEGLSQSSVQSILLDKRGNLWIGTKNGLNFYTGLSISVFKHDPEDPNSLPDNRVLHLDQDSTGTVWVSTGGGLARFDRKQGGFVTEIRDVIYSSLRVKGGMLFGGENCIHRYDCATGSFEMIEVNPRRTEGDDASKFRVRRIIPFSEKEALVATRRDGVYLLNYRTLTLRQFISDANNVLDGACVATNGRVYLSYWGRGLFCYDKTGRQTGHFTSHNSALSNNYILDILEYDGCLWLATDGGGISRLRLSDGRFSTLRHIAGDQNSLPVNSITVLYEDDNGHLWAGSVRKGVFKIKESYILTMKDCPPGDTNGLSDNTVTSLYEEIDGKLWIGTDGGGINLYDPEAGTFKHFPSTYGDKVVSLAPVSGKELMVSVYTKGLFLFDKQTGRYRHFEVVNDSINHIECFYGYIPYVYRVAGDKIYIFSKNARVYHPDEGQFSLVRGGDSHNLAAAQIACSDEKMSLVMQANNVFRLTHENDSISLLFQLPAREKVTAIDYDEKDKVWVGSSRGIGYYSMKEKRYVEVESRLFDDVSSLRYDPSSRMIWICAQNRLFSYRIREGNFIQWNRSDGFEPNDILFTYQRKAGKESPYLYFGGTEGLVRINTAIPEPNDPYPEIALYSATLDGQPLPDGAASQVIRIPWNYNTFTLEAHVKNKDIFQRNLFRYTIKGETNKMIESYDPVLDLSNLSPGRYFIEVACMKKDGNYSTSVPLANVRVAPPWYKTDGFILLVVVFFSLAVIAAVLVSDRKKEARVQRRLKEYRVYLNEKKIDFLLHIHHELRTPLTLIYAPLKRLIDKGEAEGLPHHLLSQLQLLFKQARHMRKMVDMVLDRSSAESFYDTPDMQKTWLNEWLGEVTGNFAAEAEEKGIRIGLKPDPRIGEVLLDRSKCHTVISNLLMNALKFSEEDHSVEVSTQQNDNGTVRVSVTDEGCGIQDLDMRKLFTRFYRGDRRQPGSGFGLYYSKVIVEMHGGNIGAYNNPGKGSTFYFELPLLAAAAEEEPAAVSLEGSGREDLSPAVADAPFDCSGQTMLVVEDEKELREYLVGVFSETFKEVYLANDGLSALELCREKMPSVIVSDVMMPRMDGLELCRQVKNDIRISHIPVVLLTACYDRERITAGYKSAADAYIPKPFDMDSLRTVIHNIFRNREKIHRQYVADNPSALLRVSTNSKADEDFMKKLNAVIQEYLSDEEFSVQSVADAMAVSRSSLYNKVKILTGLGVNDYVNRLRIEKASTLLITTNLNINEISSEVGFTYPRYFSSTFKQMKGMTPKQFRDENRAKRSG